ncbi:MAG TPA: hypothetical protein ENK32_09100 [Anaerolineae bacterium]|nr:hypothetical protein [Anaerolineae bacterium]
MLEGIQFVTNRSGETTAVLIDLKEYGEIWEDIYDILLTRERENESRESLEEVEKMLIADGLLDE